MLVLMRFSHTLLICSQHCHPRNIYPQVEPAQPEVEARIIMYIPPSSTKMVFPSEYLMLSVITLSTPWVYQACGALLVLISSDLTRSRTSG